MSSITKRIYVGNVLQDADACLGELYNRFGKFGRCLTDDFEKHGTFAYLNMEFENENHFQRLKNSFNNVKFKGNELRVNLAKCDWKTAWEMRHGKDEKEKESLDKLAEKRNWEYHKKIENIRMNWEDRRLVIPGRVRKAPRSKSQLRNVTFRLNVNGSLKVYKCYKTKLWGYERDKDLKDLVSKFVNNKWRDGYDHIVDRLDYTRSKKSVNSRIKEQPSEDVQEEEITVAEEKEKVHDVLASVLKDFEFDKPLQLSDGEDNEIQHLEDIESNKEQDVYDGKRQNNDYKDQPEGPTEGNDGELPSTVNSHASENTKLAEKGEEDEQEDEFIPKFSSVSHEEEAHVSPDTAVNDTETLRNLFNPEPTNSSSFKLIAESDDDIDHHKDLEVNTVTATPEEIQMIEKPIVDKEKRHLFFPHFDSPFLVGQTQLSKLKTVETSDHLSNWEEKFWENRGDWTREMKRKQRDAVRHLNKKRANKSGGVLL